MVKRYNGNLLINVSYCCTIVGEPLEKYKLILPKQCPRIVAEQVENFVDELEKKFSIKLMCVGNSAESGEFEIIIGDTLHTDACNIPSAGTYSIKVIGKKLVITAGDDASLSGAVKRLRKIFLNGANGLVSIDSDFSLNEAYFPGEDGYKYVWGDEFDGKELNRRIWKNQAQPYETSSCLNTKCMARKSEGCYVKDGNAVIFATHDPVTSDFTHRQISTKGTHIFLYGCMEIRAKLAPAPAANAIWFVTESLDGEHKNYPCNQEIDLLEDFGCSKSFAANVHRWWKNDDGTGGHTSLDGGEFARLKKYTVPEDKPPLSCDYHVYSFQWTPEIMNFCIDGKVFFSYDIKNDIDGKGTAPFHTPMITLLSATLGATTYGKKWTESDRDYYELLIDYVRLYQRDCDKGYSKQIRSDLFA